MLSYNNGKNDCAKLAKELKASFTKINIIDYDFNKLNFEPTHILYFATPKVEEEKKLVNSKAKIYNLFYLQAFKKIIESFNNNKNIYILSFYSFPR